MSPKHSVSIVLALLIGFSLSNQLVGQQKSAEIKDRNSKKAKKKTPPPFKWVNPLSKGELKLPGLKHATFESPSMEVEVGYCVYLPKDYSAKENTEQRYPVVYYLHGGRPGSERKAIRLARHIDRHISSGAVKPMIYVFVNGGPVSHYNMPNDSTAQGADVFIKELIPHVDSTYRTIANRNGRALEGFSQGGRGTARLMFRYPELFCSASPGGGGHATEKKISENGGAESKNLQFAEGDNTWDLAAAYAKRLESAKEKKSQSGEPIDLKILVHVGDKGFNYQNNLQWMEHLSQLGIQHQKVVVPDAGHSAMEIYDAKGLEIMKFHEVNFDAK
jgi:endo-1,4-beta-xylanase